MVSEFCPPYVGKVICATYSSMRTVVDTGNWGERSVENPCEVLDIKFETIKRGNAFASFRPLFLLFWNEGYEEVGITVA